MNKETRGEITTDFPRVAFKLQNEHYCITSEFVLQMIIRSDLTPMPKSAAYVLGVLNVRGEVYPIIDLRTLLDISSLESELEVFKDMKDKQSEWIRELELSAAEGRPFALSIDPAKSPIAVWFNNFKTDSYVINSILKKIDEPYTELYSKAAEMEKCRISGNVEGVSSTLKQAMHLCNKSFLPLLDELVEAYAAENKGMIILIQKEGAKFGLLVDSITSIEGFIGGYTDNSALKMEKDRYIESIIVAKEGGIYLDIDIDSLSLLTEHIDS